MRPRAAALVAILFVLAGCNQGAKIREAALRSSEAVSFRSDDGIMLAGRLFGPDDARVGVVLSHMLPADQSSWYDFASALADDGYRVLTYDFRGYCPGGDAGCSQGTKNIPAIWQDVLGAIAFLRGTGNVRDVALVGASMGGTASLIAASDDPQDVRAVITLSAPISIEGLTAPSGALATGTEGKLYIAGSGDVSAAADATHLYETSIQPKRVEILTTDDHGTDILSGNQGEQARHLIVGYLAQFAPVSGGDLSGGGS